MLTSQAANEKEIEASNIEITVANAKLPQGSDTHVASATVTAQPATKKKKSNHHKNRKKKKTTENTEGAQPAIATENAAFTALDPTATPEGSVNSGVPFSGQMAEIEAIKRGENGAPSLRGGRAEATRMVCVLFPTASSTSY